MRGHQIGGVAIAVATLGLSVSGASTIAGEASAEPTTRYAVRITEPQTQMIDVSVEFDDVEADSINVMLPTWRPGRYVIFDPAMTVREVRATNRRTGEALLVQKVEKSTWRLRTEGADSVRLDYRIYANSLGDRTRHVDDSHAFLSGESVFMYWAARRMDPLEVRIEAPDHWKTSTGLAEHPSRDATYMAPDYDVLVDSPFEIGTHDRLHFEVDDTPHEIAIWGQPDYDSEQLTEDFARIIREQAAMFGGLPYEKYVFLIHAGRGVRGATEHLNSTILQTRRESLEDEDAYKRFLSLVSHEMFHTWNVKQLRPAGINPYDYQRENYTKLLWVVEGTTSYYDPVILVRGELEEADDYLDDLAESIGRHRRRPGRLVQSVEQSSFDAWLNWAQRTPDDVNATVSIYGQGALVSLVLDMELRRRTENEISLDDVMRRMYEKYPLSGPGYTTEDLIGTVEELAGISFDRFFADHVSGTEELDFESALETVGLRLFFDATDDDDDGGDDRLNDQDRVEVQLKAYLGVDCSDSGGGARVDRVLSDGPAYRAGLIPGDEIFAMNDRRVNASQIDERVENLKPGDAITLQFFRYDELREMTIVLEGTPDGEWKIEHVEQTTEGQRAAWEDWLHQPWPENDDDEETDLDPRWDQEPETDS